MFHSPKLSLEDILGTAYINSIAEACEYFSVMNKKSALKIAKEKVNFYPLSQQNKNDMMVDNIGKLVISPFENDMCGATTNSFKKASNLNASPISGLCNMRIGEDGRLYLIAKSEHYHTPLGHGFNGYKLIENAKKIGITNATHNNTRGYITRLLEKELIRDINGLDASEDQKLEKILCSDQPKVLNRVINLETGSIACEAGIKMMLARFYKLDKTFDRPKYSDKIPVFFVMADNEGSFEANYHGTSVIAQTFRGMWPELYQKIDKNSIYKVVPVSKNNIDDFKTKIEIYNQGEYKTAGFIHEIVLMNYGGIRLTETYLKKAYELCKQYDTPVMVDEIRTCMWYKGMFLFRLYELEPDFVVIGKGFPGGQYPASKIVTTSEMDSLNQFGALVTNGQEELASLSYLITMIFARANGENIQKLGEGFEEALRSMVKIYGDTIDRIEGKGHCTAIHFKNIDDVIQFSKILNDECIDISAQIYKANCPPAALLKPPIVASEKTLAYVVERMSQALKVVKEGELSPDFLQESQLMNNKDLKEKAYSKKI